MWHNRMLSDKSKDQQARDCYKKSLTNWVIMSRWYIGIINIFIPCDTLVYMSSSWFSSFLLSTVFFSFCCFISGIDFEGCVLMFWKILPLCGYHSLMFYLFIPCCCGLIFSACDFRELVCSPPTREWSHWANVCY